MDAPEKTEIVGMWLVRADDGQRAELPREESRTCDSIEALHAALRDAKASFAGEPGARVELWARASCGHHHMQIVWVWEHGENGVWARLTSMQGLLLAALLLEDERPAPAAAPARAEVPN